MRHKTTSDSHGTICRAQGVSPSLGERHRRETHLFGRGYCSKSQVCICSSGSSHLSLSRRKKNEPTQKTVPLKNLSFNLDGLVGAGLRPRAGGLRRGRGRRNRRHADARPDARRRPANARRRPANARRRWNDRWRPANARRRPADARRRPANARRRPADARRWPTNARRWSANARRRWYLYSPGSNENSVQCGGSPGFT